MMLFNGPLERSRLTNLPSLRQTLVTKFTSQNFLFGIAVQTHLSCLHGDFRTGVPKSHQNKEQVAVEVSGGSKSIAIGGKLKSEEARVKCLQKVHVLLDVHNAHSAPNARRTSGLLAALPCARSPLGL